MVLKKSEQLLYKVAVVYIFYGVCVLVTRLNIDRWHRQICLDSSSLFVHISSPSHAPDASAAQLSLHKITMAPAILGIWSSRLPKFKWSSKGLGKLGLAQHIHDTPYGRCKWQPAILLTFFLNCNTYHDIYCYYLLHLDPEGARGWKQNIKMVGGAKNIPSTIWKISLSMLRHFYCKGHPLYLYCLIDRSDKVCLSSFWSMSAVVGENNGKNGQQSIINSKCTLLMAIICCKRSA